MIKYENIKFNVILYLLIILFYENSRYSSYITIIEYIFKSPVFLVFLINSIWLVFNIMVKNKKENYMFKHENIKYNFMIYLVMIIFYVNSVFYRNFFDYIFYTPAIFVFVVNTIWLLLNLIKKFDKYIEYRKEKH